MRDGEDAAAVARELRATVSRLRRRMREHTDTAGLTPSQTAVLSRLAKEGPDTASGLAQAERVRPQSMAATLQVLDERGLVARTPDPEDGRRRVVGLTDAGRRWVAGSRAARDEWLTRALSEDFTPAERRTIVAATALLDRLTR